MNYKIFDTGNGTGFKYDAEADEAFRHFTTLNEDLKKELAAFRKYSEGKKLMLDIGALYGVFAFNFLAKNRNATACAIEPSPKGQQLLKLNKRLNPSFNFTILPFAMGDKSGTQTMHFEWHHLVTNSESTAQGVPVDFKTIDEVVALYHLQPDAIKIDVEGFEYKVLTGARNYLMNNNPLLFIELHGNWADKYGNSIADLIDLLKSFGYRFYDLDGKEINSPYSEMYEFGCRIICSKSPIG